MEETKEEPGFDAFFFKYNQKWIDDVTALKSFKDKTDKLTQLQASCEQELAPGDYSEICALLRKMAGDTHPFVCNAAIKCLNTLCKSLKEAF